MGDDKEPLQSETCNTPERDVKQRLAWVLLAVIIFVAVEALLLVNVYWVFPAWLSVKVPALFSALVAFVGYVLSWLADSEWKKKQPWMKDAGDLLQMLGMLLAIVLAALATN